MNGVLKQGRRVIWLVSIPLWIVYMVLYNPDPISFWPPPLLIFPALATADHLHPEKYYQTIWCNKANGQAEYILPDKTRCDCITPTHAVEIDFASKWYEAIGQALYYGLQTGKQPGILLILEKKSDYKYWLRLNSTIRHYGLPIDRWKVEP